MDARAGDKAGRPRGNRAAFDITEILRLSLPRIFTSRENLLKEPDQAEA
jgi:hypothetical protein